MKFLALPRTSRLLFPLLLLLSLSAPHAAIATDIAGKLKGTVKDSSGAVVAGAVVVVRDPPTGNEVKATSNVDGAYAFESLLPREYEVRCEHIGFKSYVSTGIRVNS